MCYCNGIRFLDISLKFESDRVSYGQLFTFCLFLMLKEFM